MYQALKTAQNDIHTALLKFSDDMVQHTEGRSQSPPPSVPCVQQDTSALENSIQLLHAKQDVQFRVLNGTLDALNQNMAKIVTILMDKNNKESITTATLIPTLQPVATNEELKNVGIHVSHDTMSEIEVAEDEEESQGLEDDQGPQDEEGPQDEDVEVEEWTYKGRVLFKDSENTVYANDSGEIGDAIGIYDPVKNILKKLATA